MQQLFSSRHVLIVRHIVYARREWSGVLWWECLSVCLSVCLWVCLSDSISGTTQLRTLHFLRKLPLAAGRSSIAGGDIQSVMYFRVCAWRHIFP